MNGNYGFIHEKLDIKILILFVIRRLSAPVSIELLTELAMCDDGIGYFDFMECVNELGKTEHIHYEDGKYTVTDKGARNGEITESSLPYSVRMHVENSIAALRKKQSRNALIRTRHTQNADGGYTVALSMSDGVGDVFSIELYAGDENHANAMEKGFQKNAENIFNALIGMILNNT